MNTDQIAAVQASFATIEPHSDEAAQAFYARLFEIAPQVRPLFPAEMGEQGQKLMATLGAVVGSLHDLPAILPVAEDLARRHVDYGVEAEHYGAVGEALIDTLDTALGEGFTPDLRAAWVAAYCALSQSMIAAAYPSEEALQ